MELSNISMGSFGLQIFPQFAEINLDTLSKEFPIDVFLNDEKTMIQQKIEIDGTQIIKPVSNSYIKLCKNTPKSQKINIHRPTGYTKIQYSKYLKNKDTTLAGLTGRKTITRPPVGPIPIGAWCTSCNRNGPYFHNEKCRDPVNDSLKITLLGFLYCVVKSQSKKKYPNDIEKLKTILGDRKTKEDYIEAFENIEKPLKDRLQLEGSVDGWPKLDIEYNSIGPGKKGSSFFSNCVIISYNFPEKNSVSIRVYEDGLIHLVSCPWKNKHFYSKIIEDISNITQQEYNIDYSKTNVVTVFSFFSLVRPNYDLDLNKIYTYLWPTEDGFPIVKNGFPKRVFTKVYKSNTEIDHNYLYNDGTYYRYTLENRIDQSTSKIILKLLPCVIDTETGIPKYCKPYKFSIIIFSTGKVQNTFSYCREEDASICDLYEDVVPDLDSQFRVIEEELEKTTKFIYNLLKNVEGQIVILRESGKSTKTYENTVQGIIPYKKPDKIDIGSEVDIFNPNTMEWEQSGILMEDGVKVGKKILNIPIDNIRPKKQSVMVIGNKEHKPEPYSFLGDCGSKEYFVPFGGQQARDNMYYPICSKKTKDKYNMYIDHILDGFPNSEEDEINFKIDRENQLDSYSGVFKPGITDIGSIVKFNHEDTVLEGVIVSKSKTHGRGLDNEVVYTVEVGDTEYKVLGSDFLVDQRENRGWEGITGEDYIKKIKLLNCAQKLGLSQTPFKSRQNEIRYQRKIVKNLVKLMGCEGYCGRRTNVLTPKNIIEFTKRAYMALGIPKNGKRVLMYCTPSYQCFVDENMKVLKISIRDIPGDYVLDGYIEKVGSSYIYSAVDCLVYDGKKLGVKYMSGSNPIPELPDYNIDVQKYKKDIDNLAYGRLFYVMLLCKIFSSKKNTDELVINQPENYVVPYIGKRNIMGRMIIKGNPYENIRDGSLIDGVNGLYRRGLEFVFISQVKNTNYLRYKSMLKTPIVLEIIGKVKGGYNVGIDGKKIDYIGKVVKIPAKVAKNKYIRFDLNMNASGRLDSDSPLVLNEDPLAEEEELLSYEKTTLVVKTMVNPLDPKIFNSTDVWDLGSMQLVAVEGTSPLKLL